jgi:hypothetical protein
VQRISPRRREDHEGKGKGKLCIRLGGLHTFVVRLVSSFSRFSISCKRSGGVDDPATNHREQRLERGDPVFSDGQVIVGQHHEVGEFAGFE